MGIPDDPAQQTAVLLASLRLLEIAREPGAVVPVAARYRTPEPNP